MNDVVARFERDRTATQDRAAAVPVLTAGGTTVTDDQPGI
jgi:hypothetical protein